MDINKKQTIYFISLGILLALLIEEGIYKHPEYNIDVVQADFELVTPEGINLGRAFSTINVRYLPTHPYTSLGEFLVTISTRVSKPYIRTSISSKDIGYNVSFWWRSKSIEARQGRYLGALNTTKDYIMYATMSSPHWTRPMRELRSIYGKISLNVEALYYNVTSNKILAKGTTKIDIFIIHPIVKVVTFSLLIVIFYLWIIEKIHIGKLRLDKRPREKTNCARGP